jgi:hypothetical protein
VTCQPGNLALGRWIVKDYLASTIGVFRQITQQTLTAFATGAAGFTAAIGALKKNVKFGQLNQTRSTLPADI